MTPLGILLVALVIVIGGILAFRLHPVVTLIVAAFVVAILTPVGGDVTGPAGQRVAQGFGKTALDVGIVIAMASILGTCLSVAGGAQRIVLSIQRLVGERHTPLALLLAGFILGIPMFAETVFYLLLPLARAAWQQTGRHYLLCVLAIVAGATMTHSLVPPTPGPLFVADALGVDLATMIGCGLIVGLVAALAGFVYARWADGRWPMDPQPVAADAATAHDPPVTADMERLPPLWAALLPIVLPVVLITLDAMVTAQSPLIPADTLPWLVPVIRFWGEKNIALALAAIVSMLILAATGRGLDVIRRTVADAIAEAGGIIMVIAAGGALGGTLRQAGLSELSAGLAGGGGLAMIPIAWLVTAVIRIAQGSATVAMITAAGVFAPLLAAADPGFHPVYVAVAIGCGSKVGMWMNDSGFWVVARMSGMSEIQTLRSTSVMLCVEATVGLLATLALAMLWPLR